MHVWNNFWKHSVRLFVSVCMCVFSLVFTETATHNTDVHQFMVKKVLLNKKKNTYNVNYMASKVYKNATVFAVSEYTT